MQKKIVKKVGICLGVLLIVVAALCSYYKLCMDPYRGTTQEFMTSMELDETLSGSKAKEDLTYLIERLRERHPAWLDGSGKDLLVEKQYEKEIVSIGDEISVLELYQMASRIVAVLHDGHTYINWYNDGAEKYLDDFTVIRNYGKPLTINGCSSEDILAAYKDVCSYELEY